MNKASGQLLFEGKVVKGKGLSSGKYNFPGKGQLCHCACDWPEELCPGSLNVKVMRWPTSLLGKNIRELDKDEYRPAFTIPARQIENNRHGDGKVWRAELQRGDSECMPIRCWVVRRKCSKTKDRIEVFSEECLRKTYALKDGQRVKATLFCSPMQSASSVEERSRGSGSP